MKAMVYRGAEDVRLEDVPDPRIEAPSDAIVRLTASSICGFDLQIIRGAVPGMVPGTVLGHEGVGIVEDLGAGVRNFEIGDRVVVCPTIACGTCPHCGLGHYAQCDTANPRGSRVGAALFGGPSWSGSFQGLQAEWARVPFAHTTLVRLPEEVSDIQGLLLADLLPTGWFGARLAELKPGRSLAIFGCGPVGQLVIASARRMGVGRIIAVDTLDSRLDQARAQGAEVIDFEEDDPVETILAMTQGAGADRVVDAVGADALLRPSEEKSKRPEWLRASRSAACEAHFRGLRTPDGALRGDSGTKDVPSELLDWVVDSVAKNGIVVLLGFYPAAAHRFPIGKALHKNLTLRMGTCHHRKYLPKLIELVSRGALDPEATLTRLATLSNEADGCRFLNSSPPPPGGSAE